MLSMMMILQQFPICVLLKFLRIAAVPPHWAELVKASSHLEVHTERQVGTWQSLPELNADPGDYLSESSQASTPTVTQDREGEAVHSEVHPTMPQE